MRRLAVAAVLGLAVGIASTNVFAQAKPGAAAPPATQKPAAPAPVAAPMPFPEGAKIAYIDIQAIAANSAEGKSSTAKVKALQEKKLAELGAKNKQVEAAQAKANQSVLSEEARAAASKDVERLNVEIQRLQQDAESEMNDLQQQLQADFQRKLSPVIQQMAVEKGLQILLSRADAGIVWAEPGIDLTAEVIKRFDAAAGAAK
jgi:Skp family chaperone for outer membrane proteins